MLAPRDKIEDDIRNEALLTGVHSAIEFISEWMLAARDNIEDHIRNE
jgi:hypothetical protein